jgi:rhamnogalacturonyl hydrolase YesR
LYKVFGDKTYLDEANKIFGWLQDTTNGPMVTFGADQVAWHLALDPQGGDNLTLATGIEEGAAGIGWVYLQAYNVTGDKAYLVMAQKAGNWLLQVANKDSSGNYSWPEDIKPNSPYIRSNLDNGAAGIGYFLYDLYGATRDERYLAGAKGARRWLGSVVIRDGKIVYWKDNGDGDKVFDDPSWHWGDAGYIAFFARLAGGSLDIPGEEPALTH